MQTKKTEHVLVMETWELLHISSWMIWIDLTKKLLLRNPKGGKERAVEYVVRQRLAEEDVWLGSRTLVS